MNREQYIQYRKSDQYKAIMYYHFLKAGGKPLSYELFCTAFNQYVTSEVQNSLRAGIIVDFPTMYNAILNAILNDILKYDVEFEVMYIFEVDAKNGKRVLLDIR